METNTTTENTNMECGQKVPVMKNGKPTKFYDFWCAAKSETSYCKCDCPEARNNSASFMRQGTGRKPRSSYR